MALLKTLASLFKGKAPSASSEVTIFENEDNEGNEERSVDILEVAIRILRMNCLWPQEGQNQQSVTYKLKATLMLMALSITGVADVLYVVNTFWTGSNYVFADMMENIVIIGTTIGIFFILITLQTRITLLDRLLKDISRFGEFGKPPTFDQRNKQMNIYLFFLNVYGWFGVVFYELISLYYRKECEEANEKYHIDRLCGFMTSMWVPFSLEYFPFKALFFVCQLISCSLECSSAVLVVGWFLGIVEMFLTRISHLKEMLLAINKIEKGEEKRAQLNKCIRYHIQIIDMGDQINECLGTMVFIASGLITLVLGLLCTHFLIKPEVYTVLHGFGWVVLMFTLCFAGQRLIDESEELPIGVYDFEWFDCDISMQKDVIFLIMRSNQPLQLEAGGFFVVSMDTFTGVMKNAYSFLALIQQTLE